MTILDEILSYKRAELKAAKEVRALSVLKESALYDREPCSLAGALARSEFGIIAEVKRKSPSKGVLNENADAGAIAHGYFLAGAAGVSILSDTRFFGGSLRDLESARNRVEGPLLRKDFVIDSYQIHEAKAFGADALLLIATALGVSELSELACEARELGLEVLFEVHNLDELQKCPFEYVNMVGVNNRDLADFTVNLETSLQLAPHIPESIVRVSESGLTAPETLHILKSHGYQGFLVGETFMKTNDPAAACREFISSLSKGG